MQNIQGIGRNNREIVVWGIMVLDFYNQPKKYYNGFESFCYQNCLKLILDASNVPLSPLYINASLSLIININFNKNEISFNQHKKARNLLPPYFENVKRYYYDLDSDPDDIFKSNVRTISDNLRPIVVGVDVFYLPYTVYYQKSHATHTLVLCGFDEATGLVYITDWYEPWFYNGTISKSKFLLARNSDSPYDGNIYSGNPIRNNWAEIYINGFNTSPENLLKMNLELSLQQYFAPNDFVGVKAIDTLQTYLDYMDIPLIMFKKLHDDLFIAIKRHKFFKNYLTLYQEYSNQVDVSYDISILDADIEIWDTVLMLALKASMVDTASTRNKLISKLNVVIEKETGLHEALKQLYESL